MDGQMTAPIRTMPELVGGELIATIRRHQDIVEVFRTMKGRLGLTNEFIDNAGGLTKGHTDKMLGPSETKSWGPTTFDLFCEIFAIEFRVCVDMGAVKRMEAVWEGRKRAVELSDNSRISVKLIEKAKPHVFKHAGHIGGIVRCHMLTPKQRSDIARKGAKAMHRNRRRKKRLKVAQPAPAATA